jgi:hypothetical protein
VRTLDDSWKVHEISSYSLQIAYCILLCVGSCSITIFIELAHLIIMLY